MHLHTRTCALAFLSVGLSACGTLYRLDVAAYSDSDSEIGKTYVVLSADPEIDIRSAEFETYANQLERALAAKQYRRLPESEVSDAALAIYLSADISRPTKEYHEVTTAVRETNYDTSTSREVPAGGNNQSGGGSQGGQSSNQTRVIESPQPEILTGVETQQFATTVYKKYLTIQAVDLQEYLREIEAVGRSRAVPKEIWSVDVETTGTPSDLSEVIPVMISAAQPYLGESTDDKVQVKLSENSKKVAAIRGQ